MNVVECNVLNTKCEKEYFENSWDVVGELLLFTSCVKFFLCSS